MTKTVIAIGLAASLFCVACTSTTSSSSRTDTTTAIPAADGKASVETTLVGDLIANPATKAVLQKELPGLLTSSHLEMAKTMTLRAISRFPQAHLNEDKLKTIQAELDKVQ